MKILHIEDNASQRDITSQVLRKYGHHVIYQAPSIALAEAELRDQKFDLVICDGNLNNRELNCDGADFAQKISSRFKVMIVSADDGCRRPGIPFVHKLDWTVDTMCDLVAEAVRQT